MLSQLNSSKAKEMSEAFISLLDMSLTPHEPSVVTKFNLLFFVYKCEYLNPPPGSNFIDNLIGDQA